MKFSESWLREWVDPDISTEGLIAQLTMAGLEVDSVEPAAAAFSGVVVAEVMSVVPHPDADKLHVCRVNAGGEALQIVCGAPNVRAGMKVPAALVGAVLPGNLNIKEAKLRGVESSGMLCSARELGLADDHGGLMPLPADAPVGVDLRSYLLLDDTLLELDLTPNRGDCLSVVGVAREVAVLNRMTVNVPPTPTIEIADDEVFPVRVTAPAACPRYLGRVVRGVDIGAGTPLWMQEKLRRSGLRSLGPLVDVTNYVLLELGQPMHAFDLGKLDGRIEVRYAHDGETLRLLDGREVSLDQQTLVIADAGKTLALAGVMGGEASGIGEETRDIFLECAFFSPEAIAGTARRYGVQTDSSYRFERGVDFDLQRRAMERATQLLLDMVGGKAGPVVEVVNADQLPGREAISLRHHRLRRLLGVDLQKDEVTDILARLGARLVHSADGWLATPPSYRFDIALEVDWIEDIGRIHGYDRLPSTRPRVDLIAPSGSETRLGPDRWRQILVQRGYQEAITYSFVEPTLQQQVEPDLRAVRLANPISTEMSVMRTRLWPGLIRTAQHNLNRQQSRLRVFEIGLTYARQSNDISQDQYIGGLVFGSRYPEQWGVASVAADFFDVKADVEALLDSGGRGDFVFRSDRHPALHPARSARILRSEQPVGWLGTVHPELAKSLELPEDTILFEIAGLAIEQGRLPRFREISRHPAIRRDLAFVVPREVSADAVRSLVLSTAGELLQELTLFDVYAGKAIESGRKSLALGLILQDSSRTLTDQDVEGVLVQVQTALGANFGATLRE